MSKLITDQILILLITDQILILLITDQILILLAAEVCQETKSLFDI
jgi:hypothetical protein